MGFLFYGANSYAIEIEDRRLAHLKIAILSLLRAQQSVAFSIARSQEVGSGRETVWISPTTEIRFQFFGSRPPRINEPWVRAMIQSATAPTGLHLVDEPADVDAASVADVASVANVGERIAG